MDWETLSKNLSYIHWSVLVLLGGISFFFMSNAFTMGVLIGGLLILLNFHVLQRSIRKIFSPHGSGKTKKALIIASYYLRFLIMGILIYFFVSTKLVHPIGLTIGLSIIVISITIFGFFMIWKTSSKGNF